MNESTLKNSHVENSAIKQHKMNNNERFGKIGKYDAVV